MNLQYLMLNYMYVLFYISLLLSKELMYFTFFICNSNSGKYVAQKLRELTNPIRLTNQGEVTVQVAINNALLNYTMLMLPAAKMPLICIEMEKCLSYLRENKTMILRLIIDIAMIIGCLVDFCIEVAKEKNFHFEYAFGLLDVVFYYLSRQIYLHVGFQVHFYGTLDCICDFRQIFCNLLAVRPLGLKVKRIYSFYGVYITFYAMPQKLILFRKIPMLRRHYTFHTKECCLYKPTRIYTDKWLENKPLDNLHYGYVTVDHSKGFGSYTYTTNRIESVWIRVKSLFGVYYGPKASLKKIQGIKLWKARISRKMIKRNFGNAFNSFFVQQLLI
eukprot:TRINITY_DN4385_c0_g1_i2.p1 TRINITY_DN4385_c0_g1~~TRINITY_DN4385_c0_g1_i2.p1  ORF type:complete len:331 (+),score=9.88 TRINITY_DN4385_c0_g1_i2:1671-2663(+)